MPQVITNLYVAQAVKSQASPEFLLGATLPSFADVYRDMQGTVLPPADLMVSEEIKEGIDFAREIQVHHSRNEEYQRQLGLTTDAFARPKIFRDPHRARDFAREALDLVYDSEVSRWPRAQRAIQDVQTRLDSPAPPLAQLPDQDFADFVHNYFKDREWQQYKTGRNIVDFLRRRFDKRPSRQLTIEEGVVMDLCVALADRRAIARKFGGQTLKTTIDAIALEQLNLA